MAEVDFRVGGEAGQGVQTIGYILAKTLVRGNLYVHASQDYESRIRGGHNFFHIRVSESPVYGTSEKIDLLISLDKKTIDIHTKALSEKGVAIFDGERIRVQMEDSSGFSVPFERIAEETAGNKMYGNTVALGTALSLVKYDFDILREVLTETFEVKSKQVAEHNVKAAEAGYEYSARNFKGEIISELKTREGPRRMLINGNEALALGALAAGCKFMSGYPMTPSTGIMQYLTHHIMVEQGEDEIAAINMAIGASYTGVRAMTATSGGGFSLMVEGFGLAGMTETPVVVVLGQRPGPSTGFPTRTEQGELEFVIHSAHGEFARAVFAPRNGEDAFYLMNKAFNIAERYQIPVVVLTDQYLADSYWTLDPPDFSKINIDRGELLSEEEASTIKNYLRHKLTESGISPRALPGYKGVLVVTDSDEHTEDGHITESAEIRVKMVQKRVWKTKGLEEEMAPLSYGPEKSKTILLGWGSSYGAIREAVDRLNEERFEVTMIHFNSLWPFPTHAVREMLMGVENIFVIESNATNQLARIIRTETCIEISDKILRYDGRHITSDYIINALKPKVKA